MHLTVGVTGHRDLLPSEELGVRTRVKALLERLRDDFPDLQLQLLSPLASGADLLAGDVALELGIPLVAVLPMPLDEYRRDYDRPAERAAFEHQLEAAVKVVELPVLAASADAIREPGHARDRQYAQAGVFVSNHCQVLLALWDGRAGGHLGGTGSIVRYHLTADLPGFDDQTESPNLLADNENDLAYHIVCSRDRPDGAPADGLRPLDTCWITAHFERHPADRMPLEYRLMLERLQAFQRDIDRHSGKLEAGRGTLLGERPPLDPPAAARRVDRFFSMADWLAMHYQKRVTLGLRATHVIAVLMGLCFVIYSEFDVSEIYVLGFLGLFFFGLALFLVGERREWHRKYLDYRALAEGLRVQIYWNLAGVVETHSAIFAYDNFLQKQDVDLGWIRHVMRSASLHRDRLHAPDPGWLDWVIHEWVGTTDNGRGQLAYYRDKARQKARVHQRTEWLGNICLWAGIAIAVLLVVNSDRMDDAQERVWLVLMGVLPLVAAVRSAYAHKKADRELIKQYRFMEQVFSNARRLLDSAVDARHRRRILRALGNAALEEHAEWILVHRERPLEHSRL